MNENNHPCRGRRNEYNVAGWEIDRFPQRGREEGGRGEEGREGGREGGREEGREGGSKGGRDRGREVGKERGRE